MGREESAWKIVGQSLASYILSDQNSSTMEILKLSYKQLPNHLKLCFLYFAVFPEDTEIPVKKLKFLWIAEGFISKKENTSAESVATEYLMELIDRSLIIVAKKRSDGIVKACVVHDLVHDLCLRIAKEENFLTLMDDNYSIYTKHHRLCVHMKTNPMASHKFFLPFGSHVHSFFGSLQDSTLYVLNMKLLRVLDLPRHELWHDNGMEYLVQLRYLAIKCVPASVSRLVNLEFLIVSSILGGPHCITSLVQKMVKLRYLIVNMLILKRKCNSYRTSNLEVLSTVHIDEVEDEEMLKCLPHLRKLKCRWETFVDQQGAYHCPDLSFLNQLESLYIASINHQHHDISILNQLKSLNITSLNREDMDIHFLHRLEHKDRIYRRHALNSNTGYKYSDLSLDKYIESLKRATLIQRAWAKIKLPSSIKKLTLNGLCLPWEKMSVIGGLSNLQVLKLENEAFVGERWDTRDGEFQQLRFLKLSRIRVTQWNVVSSEHFPKLQRLVLWRCFDLQEIPYETGEIATLQLIEVQAGRKSLAESVIKIQQEQQEMGNEELSVIVTHTRKF